MDSKSCKEELVRAGGRMDNHCSAGASPWAAHGTGSVRSLHPYVHFGRRNQCFRKEKQVQMCTLFLKNGFTHGRSINYLFYVLSNKVWINQIIFYRHHQGRSAMFRSPDSAFLPPATSCCSTIHRLLPKNTEACPEEKKIFCEAF